MILIKQPTELMVLPKNKQTVEYTGMKKYDV